MSARRARAKRQHFWPISATNRKALRALPPDASVSWAIIPEGRIREAQILKRWKRRGDILFERRWRFDWFSNIVFTPRTATPSE